MDWRTFLTTFGALFLAEMGDKTQLAVFSLTARSRSPYAVFLGASAALVVVTLIGVLFGGLVTNLVPPRYLRLGAGVLFLGIGVYTILEALGKVAG